MIKFPMQFKVEAESASGIATNWGARENHLPPIPSAIPPEFMGPGGGYSPEALFGIAVLNCLIATYKVYCEKSKVHFANIKGEAALTIDKELSATSFYVSKIDITLHVTGSSDVEKAEKLLDAAIKDCAISNSINSEKTFKKHVS
jgi:organic hydroperoxide reductase OsmC/OhrA